MMQGRETQHKTPKVIAQASTERRSWFYAHRHPVRQAGPLDPASAGSIAFPDVAASLGLLPESGRGGLRSVGDEDSEAAIGSGSSSYSWLMYSSSCRPEPVADEWSTEPRS